MRPETGLKVGKILAHIFCIWLICVIILDSLIVLYAGFSCGSKAMLAGGTVYFIWRIGNQEIPYRIHQYASKTICTVSAAQNWKANH